MKAQDHKIRRMLNDFGRALIQAINGSSEVSGAVRRIRQEGFSLFLVLDGKEEREHRARIELTSRRGAPASLNGEAGPPARTNASPSFRLNTQDVEFLKSVGIDPTRAVRRRRSTRT